MRRLLFDLRYLSSAAALFSLEGIESDSLSVSGGTLDMYFIGHGTLMFTYGGQVIHVDPVSAEADYSKLPKADLILVTHSHFDHLDPEAIRQIRQESTRIVLNADAAAQLGEGEVMNNGEVRTVSGIAIEAVPAYNTSPGRDRFHPKGRDNGYLLTFAGKRVYVAGDTENHPQMMGLRDIAVAFLPMNQPYTMTPEQAAEAARAIRPQILYPYHFGDTDTERLVKLLEDVPEVEVRIRKLN